MGLPDFRQDGLLPAGIHAATLQEVQIRFGSGSAIRQRKQEQLVKVVEAALAYVTIKRVLLWGSFISTKAEPNDLDYSLVVAVDHHRADVAEPHRRFLVPFEARQFYGADTGYLVIRDYPLDLYVERLDFLCQRKRVPCGIVEINLRGEVKGA